MSVSSLLKATASSKPVQIYAGLAAAAVASCYVLAVAFDGSDLGRYVLSGGLHAVHTCLAATLASIPAMVFAQRQNTRARGRQQLLEKERGVAHKRGIEIDRLEREVARISDQAKAELAKLKSELQVAENLNKKLRTELKKEQDTLSYAFTEAAEMKDQEQQAKATIKAMEQDKKTREGYVAQLEKKMGDQAILIKTLEAQLAPLNELLSLQQ